MQTYLVELFTRPRLNPDQTLFVMRIGCPAESTLVYGPMSLPEDEPWELTSAEEMDFESDAAAIAYGEGYYEFCRKAGDEIFTRPKSVKNVN